MVIKEDVGTPDVLVLEDGFDAHDVGLQFFSGIEVIVPFVAVFMAPPLVEFASMESEIKVSRCGLYDILTNGILELGFIDECWDCVHFQNHRESIGPGTMAQFDSFGKVLEGSQYGLQLIPRFRRLSEARGKLKQQATQLFCFCQR